jgi:hypothetical protein
MKYTIYALGANGEAIEMSHISDSEKKHIQRLIEDSNHACPVCSEQDFPMSPDEKVAHVSKRSLR